MRPVSRSEEHVGEWKVSLAADSLEELFAEAARVIADACGDSSGEPGGWHKIELDAKEEGTLLVEWMNEILGLSEIERSAMAEVRNLKIGDGRLTAEVRGKRVEEWISPLKAATYHGLKLLRDGERWRAEILLDV